MVFFKVELNRIYWWIGCGVWRKEKNLRMIFSLNFFFEFVSGCGSLWVGEYLEDCCGRVSMRYLLDN